MLGRTNAVTAAKEQKTVTAGTEQIIITPAKGKLLSEVKVNPTPSQAKNVTPTDASQTVEPDEGKLLNSVTIQGIPNSAKAGEYAWRKKVAIDDAFLGFVVNDDESAFPDDGTQDNYYYYKKVVVDTSPIQYTYTGSSTLSTGVDSDGNPTWELKLLTSGTLNIKEMLTPIQDVFLVGGGGGGATGRSGGGGAGGGGYTYTALNFDIPFGADKQAIIGAGGVGGNDDTSTEATDGGTTSLFGLSAAGGKAGSPRPLIGEGGPNGGDGGSGGGAGGLDSAYDHTIVGNGGTGQGTTIRAFGESTGTLYAGGGGGGNALISNTTFDRSISSGEVNTGGGGAGGASNQSTSSSRQYDYAGSAGGSGIIILRGRCS